MNPEILTKLKELQSLIEKERNPEDKTMVDFFKPVAHKMVNIMKWKVLSALNSPSSDRFIDSNQAITNAIHSAFNTVTAEHLLEYAGGTYEETLWMEDVKDCIRNNRMLEAVKIYKNNTQLGLKECKEYVDMTKDKMLRGEL